MAETALSKVEQEDMVVSKEHLVVTAEARNREDLALMEEALNKVELLVATEAVAHNKEEPLVVMAEFPSKQVQPKEVAMAQPNKEDLVVAVMEVDQAVVVQFTEKNSL